MSSQTRADGWSKAGPGVTRSIHINVGTKRVWDILTVPELMRTWMEPNDVDIHTDWIVGRPIVIRGRFNGARFENKGTVLQFDPEMVLQYSRPSIQSPELDVTPPRRACELFHPGVQIVGTWRDPDDADSFADQLPNRSD